MKKTISGPVIMINDNAQSKSLVVETAPATTLEVSKTTSPAKRLQITTNDHSILDGFDRSKPIKITIEQ